MSFNSFVTKCLKENSDRIYDLPFNVMNELQNKAIKYFLKYKKKYGKLPTPERVLKTPFKVFVTNALITSPIDDLYDIAVIELVDQYSALEYNNLEIAKLSGEQISANDFRRIANNIHKATKKHNTTINNLPKGIFSAIIGTGLPIGVPFIDETILHFPGMYRMIFAPPGNAKTYLFNYLVAYQLLNFKKVLVVRGEMTEEEYIARIAGIMLNFNSNEAMRQSNLDPAMAASYDDKVSDLFEYIAAHGGNIIFTERATPDVDEIRYYAETHEVDFVFIDGTYQLKSENRLDKDMEKEGKISNELRDWAKDGSPISKYDDDGNLIEKYTYYPRIFATTQMNRVGIASARVGAEHIGGTIKYAQDVSDLYFMKKIDPWNFQVKAVKSRRSKEVEGIMKIDWSDMIFSFENSGYAINTVNSIKELCHFDPSMVRTWKLSRPVMTVPVVTEEEEEEIDE